MKPKRGITGPFTLQLSRHIGRRDFASAINNLEAYLAAHPTEVCAWTFLAQCHIWAGSETKAIGSATEALRHNANDFVALRMLAELYAKRDEHEKAVPCVRRGLENFPEPLPPMPGLITAFRFVAPLLPKRFAASIEADIPMFEDPGANDRKWFSWAKEYLAWYDDVSGNKASPLTH